MTNSNSKNPEKNSLKSPQKPQKLAPEDLERTLLDIDIRSSQKNTPDALEKTLLDIDLKKIDATLQDTQVFMLPPIDEEDTDLHGLKIKQELSEDTQQIEIREDLIEEVLQENLSTRTKKNIEFSDASKIQSSSSTSHASLTRIAEFGFGFLFLLLWLDLSIEGVIHRAPWAGIAIGVTVSCISANLYFYLKKGSLGLGIEISLSALLILLCYSVRQYGSFDIKTVTLFNRQPAQFFHWIYLVVFSLSIGWLFLQNQISKWIKIISAIFIAYASLGFLEIFIRGSASINSLENFRNVVLGTSLWKWIPSFYIKPLVFSWWVVLPLLTLSFIAYKTYLMAKYQRGLTRLEIFLLTMLIFSVIFGHLLLLYAGLPNFLKAVG